MKKGQKLGVEKTRGLDASSYDLYNLVGLSLGKLEAIRQLCMTECECRGSLEPICVDILNAIGKTDPQQTINGR